MTHNKKKHYGFLQQLEHDISYGIIQSWKKYTFIIGVCILTCGYFLRSVLMLNRYGLIQARPGFFDYLIFMFKGMNVYIPSPNKPFNIPVLWLLFNICLAFIVANYPFKDLDSFGLQILLRSRSRGYWWLSKCIWNILTVVLCYLIALFVILIFTACTGVFSHNPDVQIGLQVSQVAVSELTQNDLVLTAFVLPLITSISLSLLQMVISLISHKPALGFIAIVCLLTISAYYCSAFLSGNYLMILRSDLIIHNMGVSSQNGIIMATSISILSIVSGFAVFSKYDILK